MKFGSIGLAVVTGAGLIAALPAGAHGLVQIPKSAAASGPVTAFVNVSVIPMDHERVLAGQTVVVQGERIVALGPTAQVQVPAGAMRIEGQGKYLIPGLADMHAHIFIRNDSAAVAARLLGFVAHGVTIVRDMNTAGEKHTSGKSQWSDQAFAFRDGITRGERLGPRIYTSGWPDYASPEAAAASVAALKTVGYDFLKVYERAVGHPHRGAIYDSILATARRVGLRMAGHVPSEIGIEGVLAAPFASIEHVNRYARYLVGIDLDTSRLFYADSTVWRRPGYRFDPAKLGAIAAATRRADVWNCPTLAIYEKYDRGDLDFALQVTKALYEVGAGLITGADLVPPFGDLARAPEIGTYVHRELELLVQAGLPPYAALAASTRNVAEFLGTLDSTGTIAVGKRADLVLLDANPLVKVGHTRERAGVMVGGRWLPRTELDRRLAALGPSKSP